MLADITIGDVLEVLEAERDVRDRRDSGAATFRVLREMGIFGPGVPTLRGDHRPRSADGGGAGRPLPDHLPPGPGPDRRVPEGTPAVDRLRDLAEPRFRAGQVVLGEASEQHHPGICSLHLPHEVAVAWKQRLRTRTTAAASGVGGNTTITVERLSYLDTLASVRAFYLDLAEWALGDPARCGPWVAPCPTRPTGPLGDVGLVAASADHGPAPRQGTLAVECQPQRTR